ncbi:hypothetical protein FBU30_004788 [Linnemannia zychae]|nr:hypothetical protein FBU30_004788 [Linnemannia zychae]
MSLEDTTITSTPTDTRDNDLSNVLRHVHAQNLVAYRHILNAQKNRTVDEKTELTLDDGASQSGSEQFRFWDIVVVTAGDQAQQHYYQQRIDQKLAEGSLPSRARYLVVEDPPGSKIGSARTLLIHAGGYSTRLPHVSARGKIFTTLPQADKPEGIQVLDLKLVLYLHLLQSMPPGVFLTSADGIELFSSSTPFPNDPKPYTITAFAHPSSLQIGSTHGVYLLDDPRELIAADRCQSPKDQSAILLKCQRFLHKPSIDEMRRTPKLIYTNQSTSSNNVKKEEVYTDSCYYFDPHTMALMANTYSILSQDCDLEAWADVLSFQHSASSSSSTSSSPSPNPPLIQALQDANVQLDVMVLNASKFYHLGTMQEFISAVCTDPAFMSELHICHRIPGIAIISEHSQDKQEQSLSQELFGLQWQAPLFLENCHVSPLTQIGTGSLLVDTNLINHFPPPSMEKEEKEEKMIPKNTCMFTLQLQEHAFVTFTFSTLDDMKKAVHSSVITSSSLDNDDDTIDNDEDDSSSTLLKRLKIFETVSVLDIFSINQNSIHNNNNHRPPTSQIQACGNTLSLWTAPIFEIAHTAQESTLFALDRLTRIQLLLEEKQFQVNIDQQHQSLSRPTTTITTTAAAASTILGWVSLKDAARIAREL